MLLELLNAKKNTQNNFKHFDDTFKITKTGFF